MEGEEKQTFPIRLVSLENQVAEQKINNQESMNKK
jgi:hypothetical protein